MLRAGQWEFTEAMYSLLRLFHRPIHLLRAIAILQEPYRRRTSFGRRFEVLTGTADSNDQDNTSTRS